jgi:hypothetical protein
MVLPEGASAEALCTIGDWIFFFFFFLFLCFLFWGLCSLRDDDGLLESLRLMLTCWL